MSQHGTNVTFSCRDSKKNKKGESSIGAIIHAGGTRVYVATGKMASVKNWDSRRQCVKGDSPEAKLINDYLIEYRNNIYRKEIELVKRGYVITAEVLKEAIQNHVEELQQKTLLQIADEHNAEKKKLIGISVAQDTYDCFDYATRLLRQFLLQKYHRKDIYLHELTLGFIKDFHTFLLTNTGMKQNTCGKYLKFLKKLVNESVSRGFIPFNKLNQYAVTRTPTEPVFLTEEELRRIINFDTPYKHIERTRDSFLFSCFTGLAYIDIKTLRKEHLERDDQGRMWIKKHRVKTGVLSRIPVLPIAKMLIDKYHNDKSDVVIPIQGVSEVNEYIKTIGVLCNIDKHLVFHSARHTFATTVTLSNNIAMEVVSKMMGHTNTRMTSHYARLLDQAIARQMDTIQDNYNIEEI